jgi:hypothetical protein
MVVKKVIELLMEQDKDGVLVEDHIVIIAIAKIEDTQHST